MEKKSAEIGFTVDDDSSPPTYQDQTHGKNQPIQIQQMMYVQQFGNEPQSINCPQCNARITTEVEKSPNWKTYLICIGICAAGGWLGCCLIPFCVTTCNDVSHKCPNCHALVGRRES